MRIRKRQYLAPGPLDSSERHNLVSRFANRIGHLTALFGTRTRFSNPNVRYFPQLISYLRPVSANLTDAVINCGDVAVSFLVILRYVWGEPS